MFSQWSNVPHIFQNVLMFLPPQDIARWSMTCKSVNHEIRLVTDQNKNMSFRLRQQWNLDGDELVAIFEQGRRRASCLSGSFVLQVLLGDNYIDSDLDVYLEDDEVRSAMRTYLISRGYVRTVEVSTATRGITYTMALDVQKYIRYGKVIELMIEKGFCTRRESHGPKRFPGMFYGTHVMNYWTGREIVCRDRALTSARVMKINYLVDDDRIKALIKKYELRGFKAVYGYIGAWR